jgi:hypothetical protein
MVGSEMPAKVLTKMADTIFAVRLGMRNSGERDTIHVPNLAKKWGRNAPQIRAALGLIRAGARGLRDTLWARNPGL